jgi:hypothetical protein
MSRLSMRLFHNCLFYYLNDIRKKCKFWRSSLYNFLLSLSLYRAVIPQSV